MADLVGSDVENDDVSSAIDIITGCLRQETQRLERPLRFELAVLQHLITILAGYDNSAIPHSASEMHELADSANVIRFMDRIKRWTGTPPPGGQKFVVIGILAEKIASEVLPAFIDRVAAIPST
jgi:hypothetical protein